MLTVWPQRQAGNHVVLQAPRRTLHRTHHPTIGRWESRRERYDVLPGPKARPVIPGTHPPAARRISIREDVHQKGVSMDDCTVRAEIDAAFAALANDHELQQESIELAEEATSSGWEALHIAEDDA
jgi:hypothetical protein